MSYRIFYFCHRNGLMDRDICEAFCDVGAKVHIEEMNLKLTPEGHLAERYNLRKILEKLKAFQPDFIFSIGGHGQDIEGTFSQMYAILGIPYVTWFVDEPPLVDGWGNKYCPDNSLFLIFDEAYVADLQALGFSSVEVLPLGTNTKRWSIEVDGHDNKPFVVENISFVGKLATDQIEYLIANLKNYWPELGSKIISKVVNDFVNHTNKGIEWALDKNLSTNGRVLSCPSEVARKLANSLIERKASLERRVSHVSELLSLGLAVYGSDEWKYYIDPKYLRETIDYYGQQIRDIYRFSKINLNISKFQLQTTVNQRVFDVPAANGFLLTDFRPKLEDFFVIDKEVICFENKEELKRKAIYYLEHEKKRLQIIERAKERILKEHDYSMRIKKLLLWVARLRCSETYRRFIKSVKINKDFDVVRQKLCQIDKTDIVK